MIRDKIYFFINSVFQYPVFTKFIQFTPFSRNPEQEKCESWINTYIMASTFALSYLIEWATSPKVPTPHFTIPLLTHIDVYLDQAICYVCSRSSNIGLLDVRRIKWFSHYTDHSCGSRWFVLAANLYTRGFVPILQI